MVWCGVGFKVEMRGGMQAQEGAAGQEMGGHAHPRRALTVTHFPGAPRSRPRTLTHLPQFLPRWKVPGGRAAKYASCGWEQMGAG